MVDDGTEPGLRERKRLATRRAIQHAAVDLMAVRGFAGVTVDEITDAAGVSQRTFFNYFPSKEAAVLGEAPTLPDPAVVEEFVAGAVPLLQGLAVLLEPSVRVGPASERDFHQHRRALLKDNPELFTLKMAGMRQFEQELAGVVARRLAHDDPRRDGEALASRARLLTFAAVAAVRHAWSCWDEADADDSLVARLRASLAELPGILS